ncbi:MAG: dynamin family protein [Clostridia bacterium]|nr:dynamin family protein [Clostridia bacterium]
MGLADRVGLFINEAIQITSPYEEMKMLTQELKELKKRLNDPLRVAVVGLIKAGKSTLLNALLKEKLLITGKTETTYTVSWFKYGEQPRISVVMKDGTQREASIDAISFWTERNSEKENPELNNVRYVEIYCPNPILREIEFIDTPGLGSSYGIDSQNTMDFLGFDTNEASEITVAEASMADAIVYAFSKAVGSSDEDVLTAFQGDSFSNSSPINAVGVLTKVDLYWQGNSENPMTTAEPIVERYKKHPDISRVLYTILPINALLAEGFSGSFEYEWGILTRLSAIDPERINSLLLRANNFCTREYPDIPVSPAERTYLYKRMGQYGIFTALDAIRNRCGKNNLRELVYEKSGIPALANLIKQHFGNRAFLIKIRYIITRVKTLCYELEKCNTAGNPNAMYVCEFIRNEMEKMEVSEHAFRELEVLQLYYNNKVSLEDDEVTDLLNITGEYGYSCEARLGMTKGASIEELLKTARLKSELWNARANQYGNSSFYEKTARVLARSCDVMVHHLQFLAGYEYVRGGK